MSKAPSGMKLVIVESPTKARTIRKFLGKDFIVESCMGHVRDLPKSAKDIPPELKKQPWSGLGVNTDNDFDPIYCIPKDKLKIVKALKDQMKEVDELILATDEDREGESISWHLLEILKPKIPTKRMVFHEITKEAIKQALTEFRDVDTDLVRAQEARRILDRLVGYTLSPLIWKKVAYGLSAGRVQSVAVRLTSEREHERLRFKRSEYWDLLAKLNKDKTEFDAKLVSVGGKKIAVGKDFDGTTGKLVEGRDVIVLDEAASEKLKADIEKLDWSVSEVEEKPVTRRPAAPFITSTLQQESNRKLGMSARETMQVAQKLYEQGHITYMRTDSTFLSKQAIEAARGCISDKYGDEYLPEKPRTYETKKSKGAQEAHEAIRPAGTEFMHPADSKLKANQLKLYEMIWKRTVASQMVDAKQKQLTVRIVAGDAQFSAHGMSIEFPGFLRAYVEGSDDPEAGLQDREVHLPSMKKGDKPKLDKLIPARHETKPPARYTEASLVQKLEKEGVGRPSTYASIMSTIVDRGYVKKQGNALVPTFTAMVVAKLLSEHLPKFVDLGFTSSMEESLDNIAAGELEWTSYLHSVYSGDSGLKQMVINQEDKIDPEKARSISLDGLDEFSFRVGRYGAYVCTKREGEEVCASLPEAESPGDITAETANKLIEQKINGADSLGDDPETGLPVYVLTGRYGPYVQLGDSDGEKEKPKRASVPPTLDPDNLTFDEAQFLLSLPRDLGEHPEIKKPIKMGIGRFGPYVVCDGDYRSIPKADNIFEVDFDKAMFLFSQPKKGRGRRSAPLKELGNYPETEHPMNIMNGPYGPYIKCGKVNVSLPEDTEPDKVTVEMAVGLLKDKMGSQTKKKAKKASKKKKATAKKSAKKSATKKAKSASGAAAKKKTSKKKKAKKATKKTAASNSPTPPKVSDAGESVSDRA